MVCNNLIFKKEMYYNCILPDNYAVFLQTVNWNSGAIGRQSRSFEVSTPIDLRGNFFPGTHLPKSYKLFYWQQCRQH